MDYLFGNVWFILRRGGGGGDSAFGGCVFFFVHVANPQNYTHPLILCFGVVVASPSDDGYGGP